MLGRIAGKVDRLFVFDNTSEVGPRLIALKIAGRITLPEAGHIPEIDDVLTEIGRSER
jgi:hypothetical protein